MILANVWLHKVRFGNLWMYCVKTFSFNYFEIRLVLSIWFFLVGYLLALIFKLTEKWNIRNFGSQFRSVFRTLPNIQDGGFYKNNERLFVFNYLYKKLHLKFLTKFWVRLWTQKRPAGKAPPQMFSKVLNSPLCWLFSQDCCLFVY